MIWQLLGLIASMGLFTLSCIRLENSIQNDESSFGKILVYVLGLVLSIMFAAGCIADMVDNPNKYPASKYRIETEITTRGEVSDTTYIIVKK